MGEQTITVETVREITERQGRRAGAFHSWKVDPLTNAEYNDIDTLLTRCNALEVERKELRDALEGMVVAAFDTDYGDLSIALTTHECAMSGAKQTLGWDTPNLRDRPLAEGESPE